MYDTIFQMRDQQVQEQSKQGQSSNVDKYEEALSKYQRDLATVGLKPSKEQMFGRPYKA